MVTLEDAKAVKSIVDRINRHCNVFESLRKDERDLVQRFFREIQSLKVHVRGGVAYCDDSIVKIIDHD